MYKYFISAIFFSIYLTYTASAQFIGRQHTVKDLNNGTTWLRCSVGQAWDPALDTCTGEIVKLDHSQITYAIREAKRQLGGNWRLPTHAEPEAYWTGDKNALNPKTFWSVNFMTGHSYSRFFPYQFLPVLLVEVD